MSILRKPRPSVDGAEWEVSARLVLKGQVLFESEVPLVFSDARLNGYFTGKTVRDAADCLVGWLDDQARKYTARNAAAYAAKKKARRR